MTKEYHLHRVLVQEVFHVIGKFFALKDKVGRLKGVLLSNLSPRNCDGAMTSESQGTKRKASATQLGANAIKVRLHVY